METILGILIPFVGTSLGAAMVFVLKKEISPTTTALNAVGTIEMKLIRQKHGLSTEMKCFRLSDTTGISGRS